MSRLLDAGSTPATSTISCAAVICLIDIRPATERLQCWGVGIFAGLSRIGAGLYPAQHGALPWTGSILYKAACFKGRQYVTGNPPVAWKSSAVGSRRQKRLDRKAGRDPVASVQKPLETFSGHAVYFSVVAMVVASGGIGQRLG